MMQNEIYYKKGRILQSVIFCSTIVFLGSLSYCSKYTAQDTLMINKAFKTEDIISLFAVNAESIAAQAPIYMQQAQDVIDEIIALQDSERTFFNTAKALDELVSLSNLAIAQRVYEALELLSPEKEVRDAAHDAYIKIQVFWVDQIATNKKVYNAFNAYMSQQKENENLSDEQHYFLQETMRSFKKSGLSLADDVLNNVKKIKNSLSSLSADFDRNIAEDNRTITVSGDELAGVGDDFIATLQKVENGDYIVGVDYPTYFRIMENCSVASTRKQLYIAFNNRAYPKNDELLKQIIVERNELAQLLGYPDYAHDDLDDQMANSPERARAFIMDLADKALPKVMAEKVLLTQELPESVVLDAAAKIMPWDFAYLENSYKKKHFNIDEQKIAEYFPMQQTVEQLLDIYSQFLSIDFKEVPVTGLWHEDATVVQVLSKEGELLGTLILDLYPRANKYSHAAHTTIIPSTFKKDGSRIPDVSIVLANFSKATGTLPSLLTRNEVKTFFHEFGHALHAILGATSIASLSGTHTKTDFVELPSQMLEEWLSNKEILKKVSGHYQTGDSLPDDIIDAIISMKDLTSGYFVVRQAYLSLIALNYFGPGDNKDPYTIMKQLYESTMSSIVAFSEDNHFYASFGHLTGYGAKYYGYLWSKVFALDIFAEIKKHGLLDPVIGKKYVDIILSKGGACNPNELLYNFLGREPNAQAFFADMGLK